MSTWETEPTAGLREAATLGPCSGPVALVPGDHLGMQAASERFLAVARGAECVGDLLRRVDAGEWWGESGDAFREVIGAMPAPYATAGRAFGDAARALAELSAAIARGRLTAGRAIERWEEAQADSRQYEQDRAVWDSVHHDGAAFFALTGHAWTLCSDPGESGRDEARRMVEQAQREVEEADERALRTIQSAAQDAPDSSGWAGVARGVRDFPINTFTGIYGLTPFSGHAGENWGALGHEVTHPIDTAQQMGDAFVEDPNYFLGNMLPGLLLGGLTRMAARAPLGPRMPLGPPAPDRMGREPWRQLDPTPGGQLPKVEDILDVAWLGKESSKIAAHSWPKHGLRRKEFPWVHGQQGLADYVAGVIRHPSESFTLLPGRRIYWDETRKVMIIQQDDYTGTVYRARKSQYETQVRKAMTSLAALKDGGQS